MATAVDICNLSLSLLGGSATITSINPPDGGPQAGNCARWYPHALRKLLEAHTWSFATKRIKPAELARFDSDLYDWKHGYSLPSDCVRVIKVSGVGSADPQDFEVEMYSGNSTRAVFTDARDCVLTYVSYVDTATVFPTYFVQALTLLLASFLTGPIKRADNTGQTARALLEQYEAALSVAKTEDAKMSIHRARKAWPLSSGLRARIV